MVGNIPKIMIISSQLSSLPSNNGGIETIITNMINVNENQKKVFFIIPSSAPNKPVVNNFSYCKFYYFDSNKIVNEKLTVNKIGYCWLWVKTLSIKFVFNRFTNKLFRKIRIGYPNYFLFQCLAICKKEKVDYIVNESSPYDILSFSNLVKFVGKDNAYFRIHNSVPIGSLEARSIFKNSIALSELGRKMWTSAFDIKGDNRVVYNGIDLSLFDKRLNDTDKSLLRKKYGINKNDKVVLYCGRIDVLKGVDVLIDAFKLIRQNNIKLLIIGGSKTTNDNVDDYNNIFLKKIEDIANIIHVGRVNNSDVFKYQSISDIQVIPTICEECAPLACIEAMANGMPLIVTDSGGMVEYIDEDCAIVIPRDSNIVINLSKTILDLLTNDSKMKSMRKHSKERASFFSKEKNYEDFVRIFIER